jgi:hypothetical protein
MWEMPKEDSGGDILEVVFAGPIATVGIELEDWLGNDTEQAHSNAKKSRSRVREPRSATAVTTTSHSHKT